MLKCSTSLWSADLTNLAAEMKRVEPFSERFHLDVADGHYVKNLLFFPDQVAQAKVPQRRAVPSATAATASDSNWMTGKRYSGPSRSGCDINIWDDQASATNASCTSKSWLPVPRSPDTRHVSWIVKSDPQ